MLATSPDDGLIECVPSMALATVIAEHRSITRYLALHNPDPEGAPWRCRGSDFALHCPVMIVVCQFNLCHGNHSVWLSHVLSSATRPGVPM